jgi:hypothetical protein
MLAGFYWQNIAMVDVDGENLNSLFAELGDWEVQLKPLFDELSEDVDGGEV